MPKNGLLGQHFKNLSQDLESASLRYYVHQFSDRRNGQLWIFGPRFAQKWILGSEFQKSKSGFIINTSKIPCVPMFSQNGELLIFRPKFWEIAQLRAIFWFNYCWRCCKELGGGGWSWVEVEMRWVEVDRTGWSWVEVDEAGWR